jgi:hypothetical protein
VAPNEQGQDKFTVSINGDKERASGAALAVCPCRRPQQKAPLGALCFVNLLVLFGDGSEEVARVRVRLAGLKPIDAEPTIAATTTIKTYHFPCFSLIYILLAA